MYLKVPPYCGCSAAGVVDVVVVAGVEAVVVEVAELPQLTANSETMNTRMREMLSFFIRTPVNSSNGKRAGEPDQYSQVWPYFPHYLS
jgi:hypothetical protein